MANPSILVFENGDVAITVKAILRKILQTVKDSGKLHLHRFESRTILPPTVVTLIDCLSVLRRRFKGFISQRCYSPIPVHVG
jgi:hypothetical protein